MRTEETIIFDGSIHPEYDRERRKSHAGTVIAVEFFLGLIGAAVGLIIAAWSDWVGIQRIGLVVGFAIAFLLSGGQFFIHGYGGPIYPPPVLKITSEGTILVGRRRIPATSVTEILVRKESGSILILDARGRILAFVSRAQLGRLDGFISFMEEHYPIIPLRADDRPPVKVRVPSDR